MKKIKYYYNTHTLRYEKLVTPLRVKLLRLFGFISGLVVGSAIVIYLYNRFFPKPKDIEANRKYELLKENYNQVNSKIKTLQEQMAALEKRDNEVYRSIFEANPVPDSTGPHCHYEVHINGSEVDPVYFFYNDLNAEQYDQLLKLAATGSAKSFD